MVKKWLENGIDYREREQKEVTEEVEQSRKEMTRGRKRGWKKV